MEEFDYGSIKWEEGVQLSPWIEATSFPEQLAFGLNRSVSYDYESSKVCIFSTPDSSLAGDILSDYSNEFCNVFIPSFSTARLPGWVDSETDLFLVSYSGCMSNLENVYKQAEARGCRIHFVTSCPDLMSKDVDACVLPKGLTPHGSVGVVLGALVSMLDALGIGGIRKAFADKVPVLKQYRESVLSNSDFLYGERSVLKGRISSFYSYPHMHSVAKRWCCSYVLNVGDLAFNSDFPEYNHNEIVGWAKSNEHAPDLLPVFFSREVDKDMNDSILACTLQILKKYNRNYHVIRIEGKDDLDRVLSGVFLADVVTLGIGRH